MAAYCKKPVAVEAFRLGRDEAPDWFRQALAGMVPRDCKVRQAGVWIEIDTLEGVMTARPGDWIIRGVKGEIYPCRHDIFLETYESCDSTA